jgi:hypothetical protein
MITIWGEKIIARNPSINCSRAILVQKWASYFEIFDTSDSPNFAFHFTYIIKQDMKSISVMYRGQNERG